MLGPLLFQVGVLTLLIMMVTARPRRLPIWSPLLVLVGFLLFAANLDLIPIGALLILAGLRPLATAGQAALPRDTGQAGSDRTSGKPQSAEGEQDLRRRVIL